jgi:hypothetical protein
VSKAFEISILRAKFPPKAFLGNKLTALEAKQTQSFMFLPLTNPLCSLEIIEGKIWANLSANTFEMILNLKLAMAIGLNWSIEFALGILGMRIKVLAL